MNQERLRQELLSVVKNIDENPHAARLSAEKAMSWSQRNGWIDVLALANLTTAKAYAAELVYRTAIDHFQRAKTLFKDLSNTSMVAECHAELGRIYYYMAEYSLAIDHLRKALVWVSEQEGERLLANTVRIRLAHSLMNIGYWSDAEQELMASDQLDYSDTLLAEYQMAVLRLFFYRGDQRSIRDQLQLCRDVISKLDKVRLELTLAYYDARFTVRYGKLRDGEQQLTVIWQKTDKTNRSVYFLLFESSLDLLQSDYPQKGIQWLSLLLNEVTVPLFLKQRAHMSLGDFFVTHLSHELASEHFQAANQMAHEIRENEVRLQWARFRADEDYLSLQKQVSQEKHSNQILAESNALLQAVNRIALSVNSAPDLNSLVQRLREQLNGWIDVDTVIIGQLIHDELHFDAVLDGDQNLPKEVVPMTEERSWSVRAVKEGRILYDNDFSLSDEIEILNSVSLTRSIAFIPLTWENQILGVLSLQSRKAQVFDVRSITLLEYIKPVIGIAFANIINLQHARDLSGELSKQQQELTDVQQMMEELSELDELTGLPNRKALPAEFKRWQEKEKFHCLAVRLKNLEQINQEFGYTTGDRVIRLIAGRLSSSVQEGDTVLRSGDDQFVLFIKLVSSAEKLDQMTKALMNRVQQTILDEATNLTPEIAMGVVQYPDHGDTVDEILSILSVAVAHADQYSTSIVIID